MAAPIALIMLILKRASCVTTASIVGTALLCDAAWIAVIAVTALFCAAAKDAKIVLAAVIKSIRNI